MFRKVLARQFSCVVRCCKEKKTFGDYMNPRQPPSGYEYFSHKFPGEIRDLQKYLRKKYPEPDADTFAKGIDLETFNKVEAYRSKARTTKGGQLKPRLFVTMLERNPNLSDYLLWETFGEPSSTKPKRVRKVKKTQDASFKDLLQSIDKVKSLKEDRKDVLPRMTNFRPAPTISHFRPLERELEAGDLESFLQKAKKESDTRQDGMFKARMNYEWSRQRLSRDPRILEAKTFFTPVVVPGTLVPTSWLRDDDRLADEFLILDKDGHQEIVSDDPLISPDKSNVYTILGNLKDCNMYIDSLDRLVAKDWRLHDGDASRLVFSRRGRRHRLKSTLYFLTPVGICSLVGTLIFLWQT